MSKASGNDGDESVTMVISNVVKPECINDFELWLKEIQSVIKTYKGYLGTTVIRPRDPSYAEYVIIVRFDNYDNLEQAETSDIIKNLVARSKGFLMKESEVEKKAGLTLWFDIPRKPKYLPKPPFYKMYLLLLLAVFPLLVAFNIILSPLSDILPFPLLTLITVAILAVLLARYHLPFLTRVFHKWLYPSSE